MGFDKSPLIGGYSKYYAFYPTPFPFLSSEYYFPHFCSPASRHDYLARVISPRVGHVT